MKSHFDKRSPSKQVSLEKRETAADINEHTALREYLNQSERVLKMLLKNLKKVN